MKKFIIFCLSVALMVCMAFTLAACNFNDEREYEPSYSRQQRSTDQSAVESATPSTSAEQETSSSRTGGLVNGGTYSAH